VTLWDKGAEPDPDVLEFSAGKEYLLDQRLVTYDVRASIAHARTLHRSDLLTPVELSELEAGLEEIAVLAGRGEFTIAREQEDVHTAIEEWLTAKVGAAGKKIHLGRSRNDQVLAAIRLYELEALDRIDARIQVLWGSLDAPIGEFGGIGMPGYTHLRRAMPTTIGTWLGAFQKALEDDRRIVDTARTLADRSPLGTGAGYGIPVFDLDAKFTAQQAGFGGVLENPIHAQMSRGKVEAQVLHALTQVMLTLNRLATDLLLFSTVEFGFVKLPPALCTGSSIMPQKQNPDLLELIRAKYHVVRAEEQKVLSLVGNLMSGYQRDLGLTKEPLFSAFDETLSCLTTMAKVVSNFRIDRDACAAALTEEIHATEEAYRLVREGMPFRDAYRQVGKKYSG